MLEKSMKCKKILYLGLDPSRYICEGEVTHIPVIKIVPRPFDQAIKEAFDKMAIYTHVLFTSRSAIPLFLEYAVKAGYSANELAKKIYIAVGKATAQRLKEYGWEVEHVAQVETAEGVISLCDRLNLKGHLFFPRSAQGRGLLHDYFKQRKVRFTCIDLYETVPNEVELPDLNLFDQVVFTSPSTVHAFFSVTDKKIALQKCRGLGPVTQQALKEFFRNQ